MEQGFFGISNVIIGAIGLLFAFVFVLNKWMCSPRKKEENQQKKCQEKDNSIKYVTREDIPDVVVQSFAKKHTEFSIEQVEIIVSGLVDFFRLKNLKDIEEKKQKLKENIKLVMLSNSVDLLWHEFILHTQEYHNFNNKCFITFLHHSPYENITKEEYASRVEKMKCFIQYAMAKDVIQQDTNLLAADILVLNKENSETEKVRKECFDLEMGLKEKMIIVAAFTALYIEHQRDNGGGDSNVSNTSTTGSNSDSDGGGGSCGGCGD